MSRTGTTGTTGTQEAPNQEARSRIRTSGVSARVRAVGTVGVMNTPNPRDIPEALDRRSGLPLHRQIKQILAGEIRNGSVGQLTEQVLMDRFAVGRGTVRQALQELSNEGLVYRERAKGTFPVQRADIELPATSTPGGLISYLESQGRHPSSEVHDVRREAPEDTVQRALRLEQGETVLAFIRRVFASGEPISLVEVYLRSPASFSPTATELERGGSAIKMFERETGVAVARAEHRVWARGADQAEAVALQIGLGHPVLIMETVMLERDGTPVAYRRLVDRGDAIHHAFVTTTEVT